MSAKGAINIVIDPTALLPAVTHTKMKYSDISSRITTLQNAAQKILDDGVLEGPRMAQEKALAEAILKSCKEITEALDTIGVNTNTLLNNYISIEGQATVQRIVAQATEQVQATGGKDAIAAAGRQG